MVANVEFSSDMLEVYEGDLLDLLLSINLLGPSVPDPFEIFITAQNGIPPFDAGEKLITLLTNHCYLILMATSLLFYIQLNQIMKLVRK